MKKSFRKVTGLLSFLFIFLAIKASAQTGWNKDAYDNTDLPSATISGILEKTVMWALGVFGFIGVIGFVIAGVFYLTAAGDAEQEKKAKLAMKMAIIGIIVGLAGLVVIKAADSLLRGTSTTF